MTARTSYHHGDLKRALLEAGLAHARHAGPGGVALREVARDCGVTVPAVYRHYADRGAFLAALAMAAQAQLAARIDEAAGELHGRALLHVIGVEYIRFAVAEPGLFATAFEVPEDLTNALRPEAAAAATGERTPFGLVNLALDQMVAEGDLAAARRPYAELACWSMVHGFSGLATGGPLRTLPPDAIEQLAAYVVDAAIAGVRAIERRG